MLNISYTFTQIMTHSVVTTAKLILLAVCFSRQSNISGLISITLNHPKILQRELLLRILLSHLPETLESADYAPLIEYFLLSRATPNLEIHFDTSILGEISDEEAEARVRKLHLLPLAWPHSPYNRPTDPLMLFLIHRSLRIDENSGLISEIPALLTPFFSYYPALRTWMISTILPLLRLNYEYYPNDDSDDDSIYVTVSKFEKLDHRAAVLHLLSKTGKNKFAELHHNVGRDIRGLIGPWLHGNNLWKRQLGSQENSHNFCTSELLHKAGSLSDKYAPWEEVYNWIHRQANISWQVAVEAIEGWDGPGDYDLGGFDYDNPLDEKEQTYLRLRYAQIALATAYIIPKGSMSELEGVRRIIVRIISLMGNTEIPTIEAACANLMPIDTTALDVFSRCGPKDLKSLTNLNNILTTPNESSIGLLYALHISAGLCRNFGCDVSIRDAAEFVFHKDENMQKHLFHNIVVFISSKGRDNDQFWVRVRNELLWLRSWGAEEFSGGLRERTNNRIGMGILSLLSREFIEIEFLKVILAKSQFSLVQSIYETAPSQPLSHQTLHDTIMTVAISQYDSATNANRSRGGLKRCDDILNAFPDTFSQSPEYYQVEQLLQLTSKIEPYRLVLKRGEPFKPVSLRVHEDPILILGKILEQNPKSYTRISLFIEMAKLVVRAGLVKKDITQAMNSTSPETVDELENAERRIVSMCIDAALAEDDFETAYSYVANHLKDIAGPAQACFPSTEQINSDLSPKTIDDWSWRAALQAGKFRRSIKNIRSTRIDNASENQDIRHLEQCLECISKALRLAPRGALQEILNVYRRREEEFESLLKQEADEADAWDFQADDQKMPGGFTLTPAKKDMKNIANPTPEEGPISLFDLSRASMLRAHNRFSAFSMLRGNSRNATMADGPPLLNFDDSERPATDPSVVQTRTSKRDQLKNVAVGGLASGVGWLIGAPMPRGTTDDD